jgi:hypothetical protein
MTLEYRSDDEEPEGRPGRVRATVSLLLSNGSQRRLGKLSAETDPATGVGSASKIVTAALDSAVGAVWELRFRRLSRLESRECVLLLAAVSPLSGG